MTPVDRYLETIGMFLPDRQKNDILSELSDNIRSRIEDREAELGRSLTDAEEQDILKGYGHPMSVASRYRPETGGLMFGKQLIGPALFSIYVRVLGISLLIALAVQVGLTIALGFPGSEIFSRLVVHAVMQSATVTLVFVLIQRMAQERPDHWGWLTGQPDAASPTPTRPWVSRAESIAQVVIMVILLAVAPRVLGTPEVGVGPFRLSPIWGALYVPLLLGLSLGIGQALINLVRPDWVRFHAVVQVILEAASLIAIGILLAVGNWVTLAMPTGATAIEQQRLIESVSYTNLSFLISLWIGAGISLYQLVQNVNRYRQLSR